MSDEVLKSKVAGIIHTSEGDSKGSRKSDKRGIFSKLGAYFSSGWRSSLIISPLVGILSIIIILFVIRGKSGSEKIK